ncbi:unnamed protein product [Cladocopium goreaui]|uniref:DNA-(Apurinic or apyrimidinic site) lyase n=1 Tax=Cladocopium goreaui TaxID=2562237 RepID=A0A9P1FYJ3_9DINO|nr:unnamed protein product [Cladocopium goreaui]
MWPAGVLRHEARAKVAPVVDLRVALQADAGHWTSIDAPVVLSSCLAPGQSFGWKKLNVTGQDAFLGVLNMSAVIFVQREQGIQWQTLAGPEVTRETVQKFFALGDGLRETAERLHIAWAKRCPRLAQVAQSLPGLCVLQQDMVETIFGFICSQNNNVSRICLLMDRLRAKFGQVLCSIAAGVDAQADGDLAVLREFNNHRKLYAFPSIERLASASEPLCDGVAGSCSQSKLLIFSLAIYQPRCSWLLVCKIFGQTPREPGELFEIPWVGLPRSLCTCCGKDFAAKGRPIIEVVGRLQTSQSRPEDDGPPTGRGARRASAPTFRNT